MRGLARVSAWIWACVAVLAFASPAHATSGPQRDTSPAPATVGVAIVDSGFDPVTLSVPVGTEVVWTNKDRGPHTVTAVDGTFASDDVVPGGTFSYQFTALGSVSYRDIHSNATGTITVVNGSLQAASVPTVTPTTPGAGAAASTAPPAAAPGNRAGGPTMAFTGTSDWILATVATVLLVLGAGLVRKRPAVAAFQVDRHTSLAIERARRRREEFLPRRRRLPRYPSR